jgi:hypothetical protein
MLEAVFANVDLHLDVGRTSLASDAKAFIDAMLEKLGEFSNSLLDDDGMVIIDGQRYQENSASALYKQESWMSDLQASLDAILNNIKFNNELADKMNSLFQ